MKRVIIETLGELWMLDWSDVDHDDQTISITRAWDFKRKKSRPVARLRSGRSIWTLSAAGGSVDDQLQGRQ
jgi:hypothetical protein